MNEQIFKLHNPVGAFHLLKLDLKPSHICWTKEVSWKFHTIVISPSSVKECDYIFNTSNSRKTKKIFLELSQFLWKVCVIEFCDWPIRQCLHIRSRDELWVLKKMLLESDWFVLTDTIKRGHSSLWQQTQQHSFGKIKEKKKVCRLYIIHFDFIKEKFNTCLNNSVRKISCIANLETKMANRSRLFYLFTKMHRSQKRVVSLSSSSPQTIVTNVAPIAVRTIYNLFIRTSWFE